MTKDPFHSCHRQVHLDFHNSPYLQDLLEDFDPAALARQFKEAHVNSVVVFAKCVHGMVIILIWFGNSQKSGKKLGINRRSMTYEKKRGQIGAG